MSSIFKKILFSILIVDDNPAVRTSLKNLLVTYDILCTLAEDGHQALEYLNKKQFDLVLLDIEMPNINGLQVMSEIQTHHFDTSIIILSGKTSFENARQALQKGAKDFLNKPFNPPELINAIYKVAEKKYLKNEKNKSAENHSLDNVNKTLMELESISHIEDLELTKDIINSSPAVAFLWKNTPGWPVHFVSSNVFNLLGYHDNDFISKKVIFSDLIHPDDKERVINEVATDNETIRFRHKPYRLQTKSGTLKWIDDSTSVVRNEHGNITHYHGIMIDVTERECARQDMIKNQEKLEHVAHHDALTGLPNRLLLMERLQQSIKNNLREKKKLAIFYIDLDRFKIINDSLGHAAGDEVLSVVAQRLRDNTRAIDTIARIGGDEFILLMEAVNTIDNIKLMADKINTSLKKSIPWKMNELFITSSIGISLLPDDATNAEELLKKADIAMYQAKNKGRNNYMFYQA